MKTKVYVLVETYEDENSIRWFKVLLVTLKLTLARELMTNLVAEDKYGYFGHYGFEENENDEDHATSEYGNEGFVEYCIEEHELLSVISTNSVTKVWVLTEEYESTIGVREFKVCLVTDSKENAIEVMNGLVSTDAYGIFSEFGFNDENTEVCVSSTYGEESYIAYEIKEVYL